MIAARAHNQIDVYDDDVLGRNQTRKSQAIYLPKYIKAGYSCLRLQAGISSLPPMARPRRIGETLPDRRGLP
jgi:hypothetical protein